MQQQITQAPKDMFRIQVDGDVRPFLLSAAQCDVRALKKSPCCAPCRSTRFTFIPQGELLYFLMGSGEYDELACG